MPDADDNLIIYHFGLYECEGRNASREIGERSPRIYFILGQCPIYCINEKTGFRIFPISGFCF